MKVYFEESGCGCDGKGNNTVGIRIYVNPDGKGLACRFNRLGEQFPFAWAHPDKARVIESDDLPEELWYSISHGTDHADIPESLSNYKWTVGDLVYTKLDKAKVEAYKKALDALPSVKTIEDFKQIYPLIKESETISGRIIDKLFGLMGIKRTKVYNGETGIAFAYDVAKYDKCIEKIFSQDNMKPRIYISGPVSGLNKEECINRFAEIEKMLTDKGFRVFNPLKNGLPFDAETHRHMRRDLNTLTNEIDPFDYIFMMRRWTHSAGCWKEFDDAVSCGIAVIFEEMSLEAGIKSVGKYCGVKFE